MATFVKLSTLPVYFNGQFQVGARIQIYDAGTNTPRTSYSNGLLTVAYDPNNILTDANACVPEIWVQDTAYKVRVLTSGGTLIREVDNLPADGAGGGGGGGGGGATIPVGLICPWYGTGVSPEGWLPCNEETVGSATSGGTGRADDDCEDLFLHLWAVDSSLPVSSGRGASAAADWAANKTIGLPKGRGRAFVGLDNMGNSAAGVLTGTIFATGNATTLGSTGGQAAVALASDNNGPHIHTATSAVDGSHAHTGTTDAIGNHDHLVSIGVDGAHFHSVAVNATATNLTIPSGGGGGIVPAAGSGSYTTTIDGLHSHGAAISPSGTHSHTFGTSTNGSHNHALVVANSGLGSAHVNMQPFLLLTFLIKL